jgi:hypothetical protein
MTSKYKKYLKYLFPLLFGFFLGQFILFLIKGGFNMTSFILFCGALLLAVLFDAIDNDYREEHYQMRKSDNRILFEEIERLQRENFMLSGGKR